MGSSRDMVGKAGELYAEVGARLLERAVQIGITAGVQAALEEMEAEKQRQKTGRYDRRLRKTRLLLKRYRVLQKHVQGAVFDGRLVRESAVDILDGLDEVAYDEDLYIESIKRSQQRTMIILRHIDQMLRYYRIDCEESGIPEAMRRYREIMALYIEEPRRSATEIGAQEQVATRTVWKDVRAAIPPLSALIFGIDSLRAE